MKLKYKRIAICILLIGVLWFVSRPCSLRPFQNKTCWECGVEEGEQMAINDWNKRHPIGDPYNYDSMKVKISQ